MPKILFLLDNNKLGLILNSYKSFMNRIIEKAKTNKVENDHNDTDIAVA